MSSLVGSIRCIHPLNTILALSEYFVLTINRSPNATDVASVMKQYTVHIKRYLASIEKLEKEFSTIKSGSKKKEDDKIVELSSSHGGRLSLSLPSKAILNASVELREKCSMSLGVMLKLLKTAFGEESQLPSAEAIRPIEMLVHDIGILLWRMSQARSLFLIALERFTLIKYDNEKLEKSTEEDASFQNQSMMASSIVVSEMDNNQDQEEASLPLLLRNLNIEIPTTDANSNLRSKSDKFDSIKVGLISLDL